MEYEGVIVGQNIKELREQNHISVTQLAAILNVSSSHLYQVELGARKISIKLLFDLMDVMNTDANSILGTTAKNDISVDKELNKLDETNRSDLIKLFQVLIDRVSN